MTAPTPAKTWEFAINGTAAGADGDAMRADLLLAIKDSLVDNGTFTTPWVVDYSCDSATAGTAGDEVDHWAANSDVVWDSSGSAHSWVVLRQTDYFGTGTHLYLLLDCSQNSSLEYSAALGVYCSRVGFTGGSTTARPTATDELEVLAASTVASSSNWQGDNSNAETSKRYHVLGSDDGEEWRILFCVAGYCVAMWAIGKPQDPPSGWANPYFAMVWGQETASADVTTYQYLTTNGTPIVRMTDATAGDFAGTFTCPAARSTSNQLMPIICAANHFDSSRGMWPVGIYCHTDVAAPGYHGPVADIWYGHGADSTGDTAPAAQQDFALFGDVWLPWDGSSAVGVS